jgi:hypothetical protein
VSGNSFSVGLGDNWRTYSATQCSARLTSSRLRALFRPLRSWICCRSFSKQGKTRRTRAHLAQRQQVWPFGVLQNS